ncbi:unnamed protein product [Phytomonas sp. EM1]|nr:unnamed protein product [Phytomonas sp. EM1]|eukprot:CCW64641.1 unnamed protein product [Phytomonas sp. isolate EM1]
MDGGSSHSRLFENLALPPICRAVRHIRFIYLLFRLTVYPKYITWNRR